MAPRLNHRKSRNGCKMCKRRRVKCDEIHPVCSGCKRHGVPCEYPMVEHGSPRIGSDTATSTFVPRSPPRSDQDSASSYVGSAVDVDVGHDIFPLPDERRRLELFLLHHFCSGTIPSFPSDEEGEPTVAIWSSHIVGLALAHEFLLNSIFSMSALHLDHSQRLMPATADTAYSPNSTRLTPPETLLCPITPSRAHRVYFDLALKQHREALTSINRDNANALLLTTVLLSIQALALSKDERYCDGYTPPIRWLRLTRGIADLTGVIRQFPQLGTLLETMSLNHRSPDFRNWELFFDPENRKPFAKLLDWEAYPEPDFSAEKQKAYENALAYVGAIYKSIQRRDSYAIIFRQMLCLGLMAPSMFLVCVEQQQPRALAILAHYTAMTIVVDNHWIFHGMADRDVKGLKSLLPKTWAWAIEWPEAMVNCGKTSSPTEVPAWPPL
jgi:Zn(2)-Cys(6) binuclear cluster domain-containing protein/transcription factor-like protein